MSCFILSLSSCLLHFSVVATEKELQEIFHVKTPNWWNTEFLMWILLCQFSGLLGNTKFGKADKSKHWNGSKNKKQSHFYTLYSCKQWKQLKWENFSLLTLQRQSGRKLWDSSPSPTCEEAHLANGMSCGICCYWFSSLGTQHTGDSAVPQNGLLNPQTCQVQAENYSLWVLQKAIAFLLGSLILGSLGLLGESFWTHQSRRSVLWAT